MTDGISADEDLAAAEVLVAGMAQILTLAAPAPRLPIAGLRYNRVLDSGLPLVRSVITLARIPRAEQVSIGSARACELHAAVKQYDDKMMSVIGTVEPTKIGTLSGWRALSRTCQALYGTSFRELVDTETYNLLATTLRVAVSRTARDD